MRFEVGKKYKVVWIGDSSIQDHRKVIDRTEKTIKLENGQSRKVFTDEKGEFIYPEGKYSKPPIMRAERVVL